MDAVNEITFQIMMKTVNRPALENPCENMSNAELAAVMMSLTLGEIDHIRLIYRRMGVPTTVEDLRKRPVSEIRMFIGAIVLLRAGYAKR